MIQYAAERASPSQRGIEPEEVANAAVFLCSPLASGITGEVLYVDCGYNVMGVEEIENRFRTLGHRQEHTLRRHSQLKPLPGFFESRNVRHL